MVADAEQDWVASEMFSVLTRDEYESGANCGLDLYQSAKDINF